VEDIVDVARTQRSSQPPSLQENDMKPSTAVQHIDRPGIRLVRPEQMLDQMRTTFDAIAHKAFEIFERNGGRFGHDLDNWFQAEAELFHPVHLEVAEADKMLTLKAEVPGFSEKELQVSLEPRRVTITGKRESHEEKETKKTYYSERFSNQIFRVVDLPKEVDPSASGVKATYDQGVLTITLPETEKPKGREIKIEPKSA
jgi:HSP20 family protein